MAADQEALRPTRGVVGISVLWPLQSFFEKRHELVLVLRRVIQALRGQSVNPGDRTQLTKCGRRLLRFFGTTTMAGHGD